MKKQRSRQVKAMGPRLHRKLPAEPGLTPRLPTPTRALSVSAEERPLLETNNVDKEPKGTEMVGASFLFNHTVTIPSSPFHPLTGRRSWSPARARQGVSQGFRDEPLCMEQRQSAERVNSSNNHKLDNSSCRLGIRRGGNILGLRYEPLLNH